jgi:hypothetical protein
MPLARPSAHPIPQLFRTRMTADAFGLTTNWYLRPIVVGAPGNAGLVLLAALTKPRRSRKSRDTGLGPCG